MPECRSCHKEASQDEVERTSKRLRDLFGDDMGACLCPVCGLIAALDIKRAATRIRNARIQEVAMRN